MLPPASAAARRNARAPPAHFARLPIMLLYDYADDSHRVTVSEQFPELPRPEFQPNFDPVHRFSAWLERMGKAEATIEAYHTDVADLVRAYAPRPVEELQPNDLSEYLRARASFEEWAAPTVRRHLQSIKAFYRYLVGEEGLRAPGPAEALAEPVPEPKVPHVISEQDVRTLFAYLEGRAKEPKGAAERMDLALYGLCYHAALLISEAIGLTTDAVRGGPAVMQLDVIGRRGEESRVTVEGEPAAWLARWMAERPQPKRAVHKPFVFIHPKTRLHPSRFSRCTLHASRFAYNRLRHPVHRELEHVRAGVVAGDIELPLRAGEVSR